MTPAVAFRFEHALRDLRSRRWRRARQRAGRSNRPRRLACDATRWFALILVTEVFFDTADDPRLGQGKTIVAPLVYAAIDLPKHDSVFFPNFQHYFSVAGDEDRPDVNATVLKPNLLTRWPNKVYTFLEPQFTIDWNGAPRRPHGRTRGRENPSKTSPPGPTVIGGITGRSASVYNWNVEV